MIKILNIVGARPNFVKMAPLISEMREFSHISPKLINTGQHYDDNMSQVFLGDLCIPQPDVNLGVGSGERIKQIECISERFEPVLTAEKPDLVLVVGDVNSTVACARVAKRHQVKVAHVEAGLRSFDYSMPEEHNRIETDRLSDFLFVTEDSGIENLKREQVSGKVFFVGNVMIDSLLQNLKKCKDSEIVSDLKLRHKEYLVGTFHRPSNVDTKEALLQLIDSISSLTTIFPMVVPLHPRTRSSLKQHGLEQTFLAIERLIVCSPLGYLDFLRLIVSSAGVVTDSGGLQEETTFLGVPCLTMRENTERPVTVELGTNVLVARDKDKLISEAQSIAKGRFKQGSRPELWDGKAAKRIVSHLVDELSCP